MKKRIGKIIYICLVLGICLTPAVFLDAAGRQESMEDGQVQELPELVSGGEWNPQYLSGLGAWFEDNFAFRQELLSVNAKIDAELFGVSASDQITVGTDGWLYYSATLDDYKRQNQLSERGIFNIAHTIRLVQQKVEAAGSRFVFVVPPNKNTLYAENMPYYEKRTSDCSNLERLRAQLVQENVNYVDIYALFQAQEDTLYLKRDSHWNNRGAVLAYNAILDAAQLPHNRYEDVVPQTENDCVGDLARMLYPTLAQPEENQYYPQIFPYEYLTDSTDVTDAKVSTLSVYGTGSLLMYRDSFGNTLLPLMAGEFGKAHFDKLVPYYLDEDMEEWKPDLVVIERVERHLNRLAVQPPVMEAPEAVISVDAAQIETSSTFRAARMDDSMYMAMGALDEACVAEDSRIYVRITGADGTGKTYEAFPVSIDSWTQQTDYGYQIYLRNQSVPQGMIRTDVYVQNGDSVYLVLSDESNWDK